MNILLRAPFRSRKSFAIFLAGFVISGILYAQFEGGDRGGSTQFLVAIIGAYVALAFAGKSGKSQVRETIGAESTRPNANHSSSRAEASDTFPDSSLASAYELLEISPHCSDQMLKAAYKHHVTQWHPDKLQNAPEELRKIANDRLAAINMAYHKIEQSRTGST